MPLCTKPRNILPSCLRLFLTKTAGRRDQPCFPARLVPGRTLKINAQIWKVPFLNSLTWDILRNIYGKLSYKEIFRFVFYNDGKLEIQKGSLEQLIPFSVQRGPPLLGLVLTPLPGTEFLNTGKRVRSAKKVCVAAVLPWAGGKVRALGPSAGPLSAIRLSGAVATVTPTPG